MRRIIDPVITELFDVHFDERLELSKLARLLPILNDEAALRLSARAYTIDEADIDPERLRTMRDSLLQPQGPSAGSSVGIAVNRKNEVQSIPFYLKRLYTNIESRATQMQKRTNSKNN